MSLPIFRTIPEPTFTCLLERILIFRRPLEFMHRKEMEKRRDSAVTSIFEAINELGPITDVTRHAIREPVLDLVEGIHKIGEELEKIRFDVYDKAGRLAVD